MIAHSLAEHLSREPDSRLYQLICDSVKFDLGDAGRFIELEMLGSDEFLRAPVPLGLYQIGDSELLLARDDGDKILVNVFVKDVVRPGWAWLNQCCVVFHDERQNACAVLRDGIDGDGSEIDVIDKENTPDDWYHKRFSEALCRAFEVFSCSNVRQEEHYPAKFINAKRVSKGKVPFFSYRTLHIKSDDLKQSSSKSGSVGDRSSPRLHLRRGHIRRIGDKRVWVQSCMVGSAKNGMVMKDYKVTA